MNFIKKIILILFVLLSPIPTLADNSDNYANKSYIISPKHIEKDFIKNDKNNFNFNIVTPKTGSLIQPRKNNTFGSINQHIINFVNEKDFYFISSEENFLDKNSKNNISLLLFQIQPNAP